MTKTPPERGDQQLPDLPRRSELYSCQPPVISLIYTGAQIPIILSLDAQKTNVKSGQGLSYAF